MLEASPDTAVYRHANGDVHDQAGGRDGAWLSLAAARETFNDSLHSGVTVLVDTTAGIDLDNLAFDDPGPDDALPPPPRPMPRARVRSLRSRSRRLSLNQNQSRRPNLSRSRSRSQSLNRRLSPIRCPSQSRRQNQNRFQARNRSPNSRRPSRLSIPKRIGLSSPGSPVARSCPAAGLPSAPARWRASMPAVRPSI